MLNKIVIVLVSSLVAVSAMAANNFEKELGRKVSAKETKDMQNALSQLSAEAETANFVLAASTEDNRTIPYNMACLTAKGGALTASTQKLVCSNIYGETFTISRKSGISEQTVFSLSAAVGVLYVRMHVNDSVYTRLQSLELIEEPVDAIGIDLSKGVIGAQILFLSSPNVSLKIAGWLPGLGGGITSEQNGDKVERNGRLNRSNFDGSVVTVKKFNW